MKLKKLEKAKYSNLEIEILKLYSKKKILNSKTEIRLTEVILSKIANIIYTYYITNKTILFLGFPRNFTEVLKTTKHIIVPEFVWQNNMFSFANYNKRANVPKNIFKLHTKLKKKVDLIVINNLDTNTTALKESYLAGIPAIIISKKINISHTKLSYNSTGSYTFFTEKSENINFFYKFIKTILKKANKNKI